MESRTYISRSMFFTFGHINQWGCQFEILDGLFEPQQQSEQCETFRYIAVRYIHLSTKSSINVSSTSIIARITLVKLVSNINGKCKQGQTSNTVNSRVSGSLVYKIHNFMLTRAYLPKNWEFSAHWTKRSKRRQLREFSSFDRTYDRKSKECLTDKISNITFWALSQLYVSFPHLYTK